MARSTGPSVTLRRVSPRRFWLQALGAVGMTWLGATSLNRVLIRNFGRPDRRTAVGDPALNDALDVTIPFDQHTDLRGWLRRPTSAIAREAKPGAALILHGWGASAHDMVPLSEPLLDVGLPVLLIDARGHGRSGDVNLASMPSFAADLRVALAWLRDQPEIDSDRIVLVGHSVGAGAALFVAADDHAVAGVISLSSMATPRDFMGPRMKGRLPRPVIPMALRWVEHVIGHRYTEFAPIHTIGRSVAPILLVHGVADAVVPVADAERLHTLTPERSTLVLVPGAGHADLGPIRDSQSVLLGFLRDAGLLDPSTKTSTETSSESETGLI